VQLIQAINSSYDAVPQQNFGLMVHTLQNCFKVNNYQKVFQWEFASQTGQIAPFNNFLMMHSNLINAAWWQEYDTQKSQNLNLGLFVMKNTQKWTWPEKIDV
jgi:hypothetical protein